jgi:hypothetical protein
MGVAAGSVLVDFGRSEDSDTEDSSGNETGHESEENNEDLVELVDNFSIEPSYELIGGITDPNSEDVAREAVNFEATDADPSTQTPTSTTVQEFVEGTVADDMLTGVLARIDVAGGIVQLSGNSSEMLFGQEGNDTIALGANDIGSGGLGADEFIIDGELDGEQDLPIVTDFEGGLDILKISLPSTEVELERSWPYRPVFEGEISIRQEDDFSIVLVDGQEICLVYGSNSIQVSEIIVSFDYHANMRTDFDIEYGYGS